MNIIKLSDYRPQAVVQNEITIDELKTCISFLQRQAKEGGFDEISELLALAYAATSDHPA